jgi:hypothetical protein
MRFLILTLLSAISALSIECQQITPPVIEYASFKTTDDSFQITNTNETQPLQIVALSVRTFTVDVKTGEPAFQEIDPTKISVKLSRQSAYLQPGGSMDFDVRAECLQQQPCWFTVFSSLSIGRAPNGYLVSVLSPHTVYLYGKKPLRRKDVEVHFINANTLEIKNLSTTRMDRPFIEAVTERGKQTRGSPIFPLGVRQITFDSPISKVTVKFAHFKVEVKQ